MQLTLGVGTTSKRIAVFIRDANDPAGNGLTGLAFNTSGLTWTYWREDEGNAGGTSVTLASATKGTWTSGGFVEKDSSLLPGMYEIGIPNAALASGAGWVRMTLEGAAGMVPVDVLIALVVSGTNINESFTLGATLGLTFQESVGYQGSITLGLQQGIAFSTRQDLIDQIALGVDLGITTHGMREVSEQLTFGLIQGVNFQSLQQAQAAIPLGMDLGLAFDDTSHFAHLRRGKTSVAVRPKSSGSVDIQ